MARKIKLSSFMILGWGVWASLLIPGVQQMFYARGGRWALIGLFSFILSLLLTPLVRHLADRFSVLDQPEARKMHKKATPLLGGVAVYIAFTASLLVNNILDGSVSSILIAGTIVMLVSVIDDIKTLPAQLKLAVQVGAAALVYFSGIQIKVFPVHEVSEFIVLSSQIGNFLLTFLWIIGITNAMNFLDGTDGLAAGLGVVISLFLGIVAFQTNQVYLGWFSVAMLGSCLGFLPYNFRPSGPATIFLGDAGSTYIGFILACLAIRGEWATGNPLVSICTPIMIFGVLIYDMVHTTIARIASGKVRSFHDWVSYVGKDHIHHRMFRLFQGNKRTVCLILSISACFGMSAIILRSFDDTLNSWLIVFQGIMAFIMFSSVNFYQERTLVKFESLRRSYRIQEMVPVQVRLDEGNSDLHGVLTDTSEGGARVLFKAASSLIVGNKVDISLKTEKAGESLVAWPRGKVVRTRSVIFAEGDVIDEYIECGIQFADGKLSDVLQLMKKLKNRRINKTKSDGGGDVITDHENQVTAFQLSRFVS